MCILADRDCLYFRNNESRFLHTWYEEDLRWAIDMGFMEVSLPLVALGEDANQRYYAFTDKGKNWFVWYCYPFRLKIKHFWHMFRKRVFAT
jgi:hypothetical protein